MKLSSSTRPEFEYAMHYMKESKYFTIKTTLGEQPIPINESNELVVDDSGRLFNYKKIGG